MDLFPSASGFCMQKKLILFMDRTLTGNEILRFIRDQKPVCV